MFSPLQVITLITRWQNRKKIRIEKKARGEEGQLARTHALATPNKERSAVGAAYASGAHA